MSQQNQLRFNFLTNIESHFYWYIMHIAHKIYYISIENKMQTKSVHFQAEVISILGKRDAYWFCNDFFTANTF